MTTTSGALELSKVLLDNVGGLNVGTLKYTSRNIASSQLIDTKSRVFYNEIGKLIAAINKSPKFEWSVFTRYTDAVGPLESYLLPIEGYTPPDNSTATAVTFINRWEADKVELLAALEDLHLSAFEGLSASPSTRSDVVRARNTDDLAALTELDTKLANLTAINDEDIESGTKPVTHLKSRVRLIKDAFTDGTKTYDPKLALLAVKSVMAAYTLHAVLAKSTDYGSRKQLMSAEVWEAANLLLADVHLSITGGRATRVGDLETSYKNLETLLLSQGISSNELLDVARKAGTVRRPFHGRSVVLVTMCHVLLEQFNNSKEGRMNPKLLSEVFARTHTALTTAAGNSTGDIKSFVIAGEPFQRVVQQFAEATDEAYRCFIEYNLTTQWEEYENLYNVAVATDHLHLLRLKKRLNLVGPNAKYNIADTEFVGQNVDSTFLATVGGLDLLPEGTDVSEEEERDSEDEDQEEEDDEVEEEDEDLGFGLFD